MMAWRFNGESQEKKPFCSGVIALLIEEENMRKTVSPQKT